MKLVALAVGLAFAAVVARLIQLQALEHQGQSGKGVTAPSRPKPYLRGSILDANGNPLVMTVPAFKVLVEKRAWQDPQRALADASLLGQVVGRDPLEMIHETLASPAFEHTVAWGLSWQKAQEVEALRLKGVRLVPDSVRFYPEGNLASQVLGIVGRDGNGLSGIERRLEDVLANGGDVILTIDRHLQRVAEEALDKAIRQHGAKGGSVMVMNPKTGEILAMASRPTFDLRSPPLDDPSSLSLFRNPLVTDMYEPGSVLKLATVAAAIDQGLVSPHTPWYDRGVVMVGGWPIYNWDYSAHGSRTVTDILVQSLNTGAVWLAQLLGPEHFYEYLRRFGFGKLSGIELDGEAPGQVRWPDDPHWSPVDLATNSFGHGLAATPVQVTTMLAAIANDGLLVRPHLVKGIVTPQGVRWTSPEPGERVISPETAKAVREMMARVQPPPPANTLLSGYRVGGKTGTANVVEGYAYKPNAYIASFAGIAPLEDPKVVILVKIDEPTTVPWGTVVAGPAFAEIAAHALSYFGVTREGKLVSGR